MAQNIQELFAKKFGNGCTIYDLVMTPLSPIQTPGLHWYAFSIHYGVAGPPNTPYIPGVMLADFNADICDLIDDVLVKAFPKISYQTLPCRRDQYWQGVKLPDFSIILLVKDRSHAMMVKLACL